MLNARAVTVATAAGTVLQLAMVLAGHSNASIAAMFAPVGMGISLVAGLIYASQARGGSGGSAALGGLVAGGLCALLGIVVSYALGDVTAQILALGTLSSAVTGAIGGWVGRFAFGGAQRTAGMMRRMAEAVMALLLIVAAAPVHTQSTRTTKDFRWLAGRWEGHLGSDATARAEVTFSEPNARSIVGTMRLVKNDTVLVVELITLVDTPAGVEMRFRHFSPALEAYEPTYKQAMRLTSFDAVQDVFENTAPYDKALMSTQPRTTKFIKQGADGFAGRSNIIGSDGKPAVIETIYKRVR